MRLLDLLHPHLDGVTEVVDATGGGIPLGPYLHLPEGVRLRPSPPGDGEPVGDGRLALLSYGPDPGRHGDEDAYLAALRRMRPGGKGLIVFGHPGAELPYHRLLDSLVAQRCQVLRAAGLDYLHLYGGAVFTCTESLLPLLDPAGRPVPGGDATALRLAGEYVLAEFVSRAERARLLELERRHEEDGRVLESLRDGTDGERTGAVTRERDRLAAELRRARERIGVLEARITMLQGSTSLRVGQALVSAARSPLRGSKRLPGELYGMWRGRGKGGRPSPARPGGPATGAAAQAGGADPAADGHLHLAHRAFTAGPRDRLVVAGVLDAATAADFGHDAVVNRALPHDARQVAERTDPDVLVVQLSACLSGPWAHTGTGAAPDLDRRLAELLATAHALGRTAVLWRDAPASVAPGLAPFPWDAVLDGDTGVQPARLDPAAVDRAGLREIFVSRATRVRLSELARIAGAPDPLDARRVAVLSAPRDDAEISRLVAQVMAQRHRPAEVLVPTPGPAYAELTAGGVTVRAAADGPGAPWIADWSDLAEERSAVHLLDLMCAQECSGADAVAFSAHTAGFVPHVNGFRPALVRGTLWPSPEAGRLFTIRPEEVR
ncbi:hypothetical protein [Actinacidiphila glaucinigra]|uniref:Uncharacterized protein n=1 Tax=Actinacidiphila glaucinigra TaxID=235986 RepID=A0A239N4L1_9ACTN|nr:hypothetical protein [Actinacidiphila glaucinigra]SNT49108.1 hypothetical protein SAMN05216252_13073 [Actinacidiphila glaucinigra]